MQLNVLLANRSIFGYKMVATVGNTAALHDQTHERSNGVRNITPIMISVLLGKSTIHQKKDTMGKTLLFNVCGKKYTLESV